MRSTSPSGNRRLPDVLTLNTAYAHAHADEEAARGYVRLLRRVRGYGSAGITLAEADAAVRRLRALAASNPRIGVRKGK